MQGSGEPDVSRRLNENTSALVPSSGKRWREYVAHRSARFLDRALNRDDLDWKDALRIWFILLIRWLRRSDFSQRAAAGAFIFTFSLVPLLTTILAVFTAFPSLREEREMLLDYLVQYLLPGAVQNLRIYLDEFSRAAATAGTVSTLLFLITILHMVHTIESHFNRIWAIDKPRTWAQMLEAFSVFLIVGALVTTALIGVSQSAHELARSLAHTRIESYGPLFRALGLRALDLIISIAFFAVANWLLPNTKVRWWAALAGAGAVGIIWFVLKSVFTWYVREIASFQNIYGVVGIVPIFFLWLYLTFALLQVGAFSARATQELRELAMEERDRLLAPTNPIGLSIAAAALLSHAFQSGTTPLSLSSIARALRCSQMKAETAIRPLLRGGFVLWVAGSESTEPLYTLGRDPRTITIGQIVRYLSHLTFTLPEGFLSPALRSKLRDLDLQFQQKDKNILESIDLASFSEAFDDRPSSIQGGTTSTDRREEERSIRHGQEER